MTSTINVTLPSNNHLQAVGYGAIRLPVAKQAILQLESTEIKGVKISDKSKPPYISAIRSLVADELTRVTFKSDNTLRVTLAELPVSTRNAVFQSLKDAGCIIR